MGIEHETKDWSSGIVTVPPHSSMRKQVHNKVMKQVLLSTNTSSNSSATALLHEKRTATGGLYNLQVHVNRLCKYNVCLLPDIEIICGGISIPTSLVVLRHH
jgi:hypothetical protein